jgi:hypothetical protein
VNRLADRSEKGLWLRKGFVNPLDKPCFTLTRKVIEANQQAKTWHAETNKK